MAAFSMGDARELLCELPDESVQCIVTSPPYWGLRDYGNIAWIGGDASCSHQQIRVGNGTSTLEGGQKSNGHKREGWRNNICGHCGARQSSNGIGLEATLDEHIEALVAVLRAARRVLRRDGTLRLNYGDAYSSGMRTQYADYRHKYATARAHDSRPPHPCWRKPKDLMFLSARVALALQADGWWVRSEIVWHKCLSGGAWLYAKTQKGVGPQMLKDLARLDPGTVQLWNGEKWEQVVSWAKRDDNPKGIELVLRSGERIGCTAEHRWPTQRGLVRADGLVIGDTLEATDLPSQPTTSQWMTHDAFWFVGLYLAEGSMSGDTLQLSGHVKERGRWERIQRLCAHYGASPSLHEYGNSQNIHIDRAHALHAMLRTFIAGKGALGKHFTMSLWGLCNEDLYRVMTGYLEGDGHADGNRVRLGFARNYALERDLRCLAARLGATLTLKLVTATYQGGKRPAFRGEWRWGQSGHWNEKNRAEIVGIRKSRARQFWDVSVADDPHLFALASGVLTHNSNPMPESVQDRPTSAHEKLFLLTRSARYYYDAEAVRTEGRSGPANLRNVWALGTRSRRIVLEDLDAPRLVQCVQLQLQVLLRGAHAGIADQPSHTGLPSLIHLHPTQTSYRDCKR